MGKEISFERNMSGSFMRIQSDETIIELDEKILLKGGLQGLLETEKCIKDGQTQYWYTISSQQSLDTICGIFQPGMEMVQQLVQSLCREVEIMECHLLNSDCILLSPELIFRKNGSPDFCFTFFPGEGESLTSQFRNLMEYILSKLDHKDPETVSAVYTLYERTLEDNYSLQDLRDILRTGRINKNQPESMNQSESLKLPESMNQPESMRQTESMNLPKSINQAQSLHLRDADIREKAITDKKAASAGKIPSGRELILEEDDYSDEEQKTGLMSKFRGFFRRFASEKEEEIFSVTPDMEPEEEENVPASAAHPTVCLTEYLPEPDGILIYDGTGNFSNIRLQGDMMTIGCSTEATVLIRKDTISHLQARVTRTGGNWCMEDLNSTNGTFINGEALSYKEKRILKINDIVRFADVKYRFV